jgi:DnaJ-class molecular chaperone
MRYFKIVEDTRCEFCEGSGSVDFCGKTIDCSKCSGDGFTMEEKLMSIPELVKFLQKEKRSEENKEVV